MGIGTIERTALGGGDGDDINYVRDGIWDAEALLKQEAAKQTHEIAPGEVAFTPALFVVDTLRSRLTNRRINVGVDTGRLVLRRPQFADWPKIDTESSAVSN